MPKQNNSHQKVYLTLRSYIKANKHRPRTELSEAIKYAAKISDGEKLTLKTRKWLLRKYG